MTADCPIHNVEMEQKEGQFGVYFSHNLPLGYCNGKKVTPFKFKSSIKGKGGQTYSTPPMSSTKTLDGEKPMLRKDWDRKEFIKGLAVFSSSERQQGMSPVEADQTSHVWDWLYVAYGDYPDFAAWVTEAKLRVKRLAAKGKKEEQEDMIEAFDREPKDI
jgi:hypothetical protein